MKILRLPAYFVPEQMSSTHLQIDRLESFSKAGIEVIVYTPVPTRGVSSEIAREYKKRLYEELYDGKVIVHRFRLADEKKNHVARAARYTIQNIIQYFLAIKEKNIDLVYGSSTPPTQGVLCAFVKNKYERQNKRHVPYVYVVQDIFPDSLVNAGLTKKNSILWKIGRKIENYTYKNADKIIVISDGFKHNLMEKEVPEDKIEVIPNWVDTESVYPVKREDNILFDRYTLDREKFYICYCGNLGHSQNLELLAETAKCIKEELPHIQFVIIGEGVAKEKFASLIKEWNLDNIVLLPFQPYEDIASVFSLGDVGLIISKPGISGSSVPSKTFSIMSAGRPVLASFDRDSELCRLIEKAGCGMAAEAGRKEELISAIKTFYQNRDICCSMGNSGRKYVEENLNKKKCTDAYIEVLKRSVCEKSGTNVANISAR